MFQVQYFVLLNSILSHEPILGPRSYLLLFCFVFRISFHIYEEHCKIMALMFWGTMYLGDIICGEFQATLRNSPKVTKDLIEWFWVGVPSLIMSVLGARLIVWQAAIDSSSSVADGLDIQASQWYWLSAITQHQGDSFADYVDPPPPPVGIDLVSYELFWYCRGLVASTSGDLRLLTVHSGVAIASSVVYRVQLGSSDVIHSFALPALGIKSDVLPGRINSVVLVCLNSGLLLGQCSELCGSYHGFMPLTLILAA